VKEINPIVEKKKGGGWGDGLKRGKNKRGGVGGESKSKRTAGKDTEKWFT